MKRLERQSKQIDKFLRFVSESSIPYPLSMGLDMIPTAKHENIKEYQILETVIEELDLVKLINGGNNSTLNGQNEYLINQKGRELVNENKSCIHLLIARDVKRNKEFSSLFDQDGWNEYFDERIEKRVSEADYFLDILASENILNLDKKSIQKYFKKWYSENQSFDLQIKDGDIAFEDGDFQLLPDFDKDNLPKFIKWFQKEKSSFLTYLKQNGVKTNSKSMKETNIKEVYVTYSWDEEEHNEKVLSFVDELRQKGFNAEMDKLSTQNHTATDFSKMMHQIMTNYPKVIVVLSKGYKEKANSFKGGVGKEYSMILKDIEQSTNKFILVSFNGTNDDIIPLDFREREIIDLSKKENLNVLYSKLQDENIIEFSEVFESKPKVIKRKIRPFEVGVKTESNTEKKTIRKAPTVFFIERLAKAFPGVRGLKWFNGKLAIDGLTRFLKDPIVFDEAQDYGTFSDPIWWFRGSSALSLHNYQDIGEGKILLNNKELLIDKIAVFNSRSYYSSFIYVQASPDRPSGVNEISDSDIKRQIETFGYASEPFGIYKDHVITAEEEEDGAAMINGEYTETEGSTSRERFLSKYNIILVPKSSPHNSRQGELLGAKYMSSILSEERTLEEFVEEFIQLPKSELDK